MQRNQNNTARLLQALMGVPVHAQGGDIFCHALTREQAADWVGQLRAWGILRAKDRELTGVQTLNDRLDFSGGADTDVSFLPKKGLSLSAECLDARRIAMSVAGDIEHSNPEESLTKLIGDYKKISPLIRAMKAAADLPELTPFQGTNDTLVAKWRAKAKTASATLKSAAETSGVLPLLGKDATNRVLARFTRFTI